MGAPRFIGPAHGGLGWWAVPRFIVAFAFLALVIAAIVYLLAHRTRLLSSALPSRGNDPEQLLGERLARGEIDTEEYRLRINALRDAQRGGPPS